MASAENRSPDPQRPSPRQTRALTPRNISPTRFSPPQSALEGERKQVTVLFADVKGSMELAEQVDPEEWHQIMDASSRSSPRACIASRARSTSSPATASWRCSARRSRTRTMRSGRATRRCTCATRLRRYADELRRTPALSFAVRMGLNSGEVVVGRIGDDLRMDYTAQGHTVGPRRAHGAARRARARSTSRAHTARLVRATSAFATSGCSTVKGVREPLRVFELEGVGALRTRFDVSRARGFSRFVGRDAEMAAWRPRWRGRSRATGRSSASSPRPGVGKSRLCYEFVERCRARGIAVHEAHGAAHGKMVPFLPVLELLRGYFGITEQDSDAGGAREDRRHDCCCSTPPWPTPCRSSSTSSASRIPSARCRASTPRCASAASSRP